MKPVAARRKLLSLLLCLSMIFSMVPISAFAASNEGLSGGVVENAEQSGNQASSGAEGSPNLANSQNPDDSRGPALRNVATAYDLTDAHFQLQATLKINGELPSTTQRYENGDTFSLALSWIVPNAYSSPSNTYTYTFSDNVLQLSGVSGVMHNGKDPLDPDYAVYGDFSVTDGTLTVTYNDAFYALNDRYSSLTLEGTLVITEETITDVNGGYSFTIPGLDEYNVSLYTQNGLNVVKTGTRVVDNETGQIRYDYTVTVTALKNSTDVHVWDGLQMNGGSNQSLRIQNNITTTLNGQPYSNFTNSAFLSPVTNVVNSSSAYRVAELVIPSMAANDVFELTYSMTYTEANSASDAPYAETTLTNVAKASSNENAELTDTDIQMLRSSWLHKKAERDADNNLLWTISVDPGHFTALTLKDVLGERQTCPDETPVYVYATDQVKSINGGTLVETTTFGALKNGHSLTWPENSKPYRVIQFVSVPESGTYWENTANLLEVSREARASYSVGNTSPTVVTKTLDRAEHVGSPGTRAYLDLRLFSTIEMTVGDEAQSLGSAFFLADVPSSNYTNSAHTYESVQSITVWNETTQAWENAADRFTFIQEMYDGKPATIFRFVDGDVIPETYHIELTTVLAYANTCPNSDTVFNKVYWKRAAVTDGQTNWRCWWTFLKPTKEAVESLNNQIVWRVGLPNLRNSLYDIDSGDYVLADVYDSSTGTTVTDTLPAGLSFVCAAYDNADPQPGCRGEVIPAITENANGTTTLVFPAQPSGSLYIRTQYTGDYMSLTESTTFRNEMQINLRTQPSDAPVNISILKATANGTITPPKPCAKESVYDASTAPFAKYTVTLNETAADMIPAEATSQTYKIVDELGSALQLDTTSFLIDGEPLSAYPNLELTLTQNGFEMDGFLDETAYSITYRALVVLEPDGTTIFPAGSAANTLRIPDGYIPGGEYSVMTEEQGQILFASGISGGSTAQLRVVKSDDTLSHDPVSGAVFTVYDYGTGYAPAASGTEVRTLTTNDFGQTPFMDIEFGRIYGIQETVVPEGYTDPTEGEVRYFVRRAQDMTGDYASNVTVFDNTALCELSFENHKLFYGDLAVTKAVEGNACDVNKPFDFTVTLNDATLNGTYGDMTFVDGVATFSLKHGESKTATGLLEGLTYSVTEEDYSADGYVTTKTGETGEIVRNETATATFTNTRDLIFSLRITKQNSEGAALPEAGFRIYSDAECTQLAQVYVDAECTTLLSSVTNDGALWTNASGQIYFYGLEPGTYYVKEFRTPTGYALLSTPVTLAVSDDGTATVSTANGLAGNATVTADRQIQIAVTDQKLNTDIPLTGGLGVLAYTLAGVGLMAGALILLLAARKLRRRI